MKNIDSDALTKLIQDVKTEIKGKASVNHTHSNYATSNHVHQYLSYNSSRLLYISDNNYEYLGHGGSGSNNISSRLFMRKAGIYCKLVLGSSSKGNPGFMVHNQIHISQHHVTYANDTPIKLSGIYLYELYGKVFSSADNSGICGIIIPSYSPKTNYDQEMFTETSCPSLCVAVLCDTLSTNYQFKPTGVTDVVSGGNANCTINLYL